MSQKYDSWKMNTSFMTGFRCRTSKAQKPINSVREIASQLFRSQFVRVLMRFAVLIALAFVLSSTAFGANPAEELAKMGHPGGLDPKGNSWESIHQSVLQFGHPDFILRLFLSLVLAVACAWVIAWHPRRASLFDPLSDLEERK